MQQEAGILAHAAALPQEERQRQREARQAAGPPPDLLRQLHAAAGGLAAGAAQRQRLAGGVFRPSHILPTMSVEQFGEVEYARWVGCCWRGEGGSGCVPWGPGKGRHAGRPWELALAAAGAGGWRVGACLTRR